MKIVNFGESYQIYPDDLKTFDHLPAQTYKIKFSEMTGFSLEKVNDLQIKESKIYGQHETKVDKVMRTYHKTGRSLGVILSGDKGIGKTMSLQLLASRMIDTGKPVIIVDASHPGLSNFIDSIEQEALIIFDEFEKVFSKRDAGDTNNNDETQTSLLSLFDGTSSTKRLYAITVNHLHNTSSYLLNRPGRFHYHFRYDYPTYDEVLAYLDDKCDTNVKRNEKIKAADFSMKVSLNYDMLRAIAQELNYGEPFASAIQDLNIISENSPKYKVKIALASGAIMQTEVSVDLFAEVSQVYLDEYVPENRHMASGDFVIDTSMLIGNKSHFDVPLKAVSQFNVTADFGEVVDINIKDVKAITIQLTDDVNRYKYVI